MSFECEHRGNFKRIELCQLCGNVGKKIEVFECKLHGECTIHAAGIRKENKGNLPLLPVCLSCPDRTSLKDDEIIPEENILSTTPNIILPHKEIIRRSENWNADGLFNTSGTAPFSEVPYKTPAKQKIMGLKRTKKGIKLQINPLFLDRARKIQNGQNVQALSIVGPDDSCFDKYNTCCGCCYVFNICFGNGSANYTLTGKNRCGIMYVGSAANKYCINGAMANFLPAQSIWPQVRTWLRRGGRIVGGTEWDCGANLCCSPSDHDLINSFFSAVGSSISTDNRVAPQYGIGPVAQPLLSNVRVTRGVTAITTNATSAVTGGISLANAINGQTFTCQGTNISDGFPCAAVENVGSGSVFCVGDSNFWGYNTQLQVNFNRIAPYV